ncbi:hypothetical protein [Rhodobaculum claviforme]|uniref:Uncharacterized protein n=1 Tax=Rhodobaculum claviforme TaxID=1549854 RepID=A0A934TMY7_9RHOB|nr:hypothetical protein [Rhodobaculum claviforme]MBK5928466.1 hypothetical protein [Rhodobaculum claviforme]
MVLGMVIAVACLGWGGLMAALLLGQPVWLALAVQSGLGAGLMLVWSSVRALRGRTVAWMPDPAEAPCWTHARGAALPPAIQRALLPPR